METVKLTWYSVTIETRDEAGDWIPVEAPCTRVSEMEAADLAERTAREYCLDEEPRIWRVRVFAGYNRYDNLLHELSR
jgi:hypothetical protein